MVNFFKKGELKLLWPFYVGNLFAMFFIYSAFYVIYFINLDFSLLQIGIFGSVMILAKIIFEIPTGAVADIYGRKFSTILGMMGTGITFFLMFFTTNFYALAFMFFIVGFFMTFVSGADQAWVVDLLKRRKKSKLINSYFVKDFSIGSFSMFLSGLIGALVVAKFGLSSIWILSGLSMILMGLTYSFGKEHFVKKKQYIREHTKDFFDQTKNSLKYSLKNKAISIFLLAGIFWSLASVAASNQVLWVPLLSNLGLRDSFFGIIGSIAFGIGIFAPFIAQKVSNKMKSRRNYLILILSFMFILVSSTIFLNSLIPLVALYILIYSSFLFFVPISTPFFHSFIPNKMRATITSIRSLSVSIVMVLVPILIGFLADNFGLKIIIVSSGLLFVPAIIIFSRIKEKNI